MHKAPEDVATAPFGAHAPAQEARAGQVVAHDAERITTWADVDGVDADGDDHEGISGDVVKSEGETADELWHRRGQLTENIELFTKQLALRGIRPMHARPCRVALHEAEIELADVDRKLREGRSN